MIMSFDGILLRKLTSEFKDKLTGGRIIKIYQLSKYDLLFNIKADQKEQLLISASPNYARIHLTNFTYEKPDNPPTFCMFLRKHFEGGIIEKIHQVGTDRVVIFEVKKRNELGDLVLNKLIIEVMGRHANIIATDHNFKILEAVKHVLPFEDKARTIFKGAIYQEPLSDKIDPYDEYKRNQFLDNPEHINEKTFQSHFNGFSPLLSKEIIFRYETSKVHIKEIFKQILSETSPALYEHKKSHFYYTELKHLESSATTFDSVNDLVDKYYYDRDKIDIIKQKSKGLHKFIKNYSTRLNNKIEKLNRDLRNTSKMDTFRKKGEFIQANIYQIKKGDSTLVTTDYYDNTEITIALDPKLTPTQNSEKYFKKYKKLKNGVPYINAQINDAKLELKYFVELMHQIETATLKDVEEIREELEDKKYLRKLQKNKKRKKKPNFDTYIDPEGVEILVGKNNLQNEYITHKLARHNEVWFHVKEAPGSHVLVRKTFPLSETTIRTAANIAAYFSKMRKSGTVPIDYVEKRYLKKVPGRVTSFVTYTNNKTIYIDPDENFVLSLMKK